MNEQDGPGPSDTERLEWLLPVMAGAFGDPVGEQRTGALQAALAVGLRGRDAIDYAMEGCPP